MSNSTSPSPSPALPPVGAPANSTNAAVLPTFAALAILAVGLPMRDFYRKSNLAACSMIVAVTILNIYIVINAILWPNDDWEHWWKGQGLCDLEVNTRSMMTTTLYCSLTCFTKNLADVFDTEKHSFFQTSAMKRRKFFIDFVFCWFLPILQIALVYLVSLGRYSIFPVYGCFNEVDNSWPWVVFYLIWNPIFTLSTVYFAVLMLRGLHKYRTNISGAIASSGSGMTSRYFLKLVMIAISLLVVYLPVQFYYFYKQLPIPFHAYNFAAIHDPAIWDPIMFYHTWDSPQLQYNGWTSVAFSFMAFCYFGFNDDAIDKYRRGLVICGLGLIWPSLKKPRERRRGRNSAKSGFWSHFDLVSKTMKYFDSSQGTTDTTLATPSETTQPTKVSQATFSLVHISTNTGESTHTCDSLKRPDADTASAGPLPPEAAPAFDHSVQVPKTIPGSETLPSQTRIKTLFSTFRTNINLPFPLFPSPRHSTSTRHKSSSSNNSSLRRHVSNNQDLEAAHLPPMANTYNPPRTITNIWSDGQPIHSDIKPAKCQGIKKGTKSYREREHRQMATSQENCGRGVIVKKELERIESDADVFSAA